MKLPGWLKAIGAALVALAGIILGIITVRRLEAVLGQVPGASMHWLPSPRGPGEILVDIPGDPDPARVGLPPGITAGQVKAVTASVVRGSATVEIHHDSKDRRGMLAGGQG